MKHFKDSNDTNEEIINESNNENNIVLEQENEDKSNKENISNDNKIVESNTEFKKSKNKISKEEIIQFFKFLAFSLSAGIIQLLSFELLYSWTKALPWWPSYLISIILSVIWNFTFNRKFTFKSATNVPISMTLALAFYVMFIPVSVFGGQALENIGWNGTLVTLLMMVINFITEFFWDKYIVFNKKVVDKFIRKK